MVSIKQDDKKVLIEGPANRLDRLFWQFKLSCWLMKWKYLFTTLLILGGFVFTRGVHSQIPGLYIDTGVNSGFFYARELGNMKQGNVSLNYGLGLGFYKTHNEKTVLNAELGLGARLLTRTFSNRDYRYQFWAPELFVLVNHQIGEKFFLEGGLGYTWVQSTVEFNYASFPLIPADDFREWDIMIAAGAEYRLSRVVSVIARLKWGFVPMLDYQPIGDLGELLEPYNDLYYRSVHLGIRFNLIQKRNE